jgi:hypothetical protein
MTARCLTGLESFRSAPSSELGALALAGRRAAGRFLQRPGSGPGTELGQVGRGRQQAGVSATAPRHFSGRDRQLGTGHRLGAASRVLSQDLGGLSGDLLIHKTS